MHYTFRYRFTATLLAIAVTGGLLQSCADRRIIKDDSALRERLIAIVMAQRGVPYILGGTRPETGFDCSGLIQYGYAQLGLRIPRNSYEQYRFSTPVYISRLQPGDLLFFRTSSVFVSHVALYIGNNQFIHAPGQGRHVAVDNLDSAYWQKHLVGGGSIIDRATLIARSQDN